MDNQLREFLMERNLKEDEIQKLEDENIDQTVIPLMTDSDLAKYIPKAGDRVSTVAFCRQASLSQNSQSRKESILSRLRQRLSGAEGMPSKKRTSKGAGNTNAKRKVRRIEVGWMDFDEEEERFKQVKSVSGGGTRHLSIDKDETVANIKLMAENLFFPKGLSKKNRSLSHYSTHIESSQMHVDMSNTVDELYNQSKVKILRLYLCTTLLPPEGLHSFIAQKKPTAKTVKELLNFPEEMTAAQSTVSRYLKRYIGEIDSNNLQLFLRFCTGSDLLDKAILIEFIETTDFLRRPQSHTCGCVLKLPIGYYSYPDFRSEFNSILTSSMWVMDVV